MAEQLTEQPLSSTRKIKEAKLTRQKNQLREPKLKLPEYNNFESLITIGYEGHVHNLFSCNRGSEPSRMTTDLCFVNSVKYHGKKWKPHPNTHYGAMSPERRENKILQIALSKDAFGGHQRFWENFKRGYLQRFSIVIDIVRPSDSYINAPAPLQQSLNPLNAVGPEEEEEEEVKDAYNVDISGLLNARGDDLLPSVFDRAAGEEPNQYGRASLAKTENPDGWKRAFKELGPRPAWDSGDGDGDDYGALESLRMKARDSDDEEEDEDGLPYIDTFDDIDDNEMDSYIRDRDAVTAELGELAIEEENLKVSRMEALADSSAMGGKRGREVEDVNPGFAKKARIVQNPAQDSSSAALFIKPSQPVDFGQPMLRKQAQPLFRPKPHKRVKGVIVNQHASAVPIPKLDNESATSSEEASFTFSMPMSRKDGEN